ncbi:hypothetical protein Tco_0476321 [Tanacetum coccineum]
MEQYLALIQDNMRPGIVKPEIDDDIKFEINGNFMRELRHKLFKCTDDEDAHEHVRRVLEIVDLFHFPGVTHDAVMLRMFPITLSGPALRWKNRLSTWVNHYMGSSLERLDIPTRIRLDSKGFIPLMSPAQAFKSIQVMADHSHNWYDEATTRESINDSLDNVDTKKLKENIHDIQVTDDEWIKKFIENMDSNIRALKTTTKNLQEKVDQLTQTALTNSSERVKGKTKMGKKDMEEPVPRDLLVVQPYVPPMPFPGHPKKQKDNPYKTHETIGIPEKIHTKKAQEDEGDIDDGWDITIKDIKRLSQILIPTIHTLPNLKPVVQPYMPRGPVRDEVRVVREKELEYDIPLQNGEMQSLTPQTVHITPLDDDYVAPATRPLLEKHLNEFGEEISDITRVAEKADGNLVNDVKKRSNMIKTYDFETFIWKLLHQDLNSKETEFEISSTHNHMV